MGCKGIVALEEGNEVGNTGRKEKGRGIRREWLPLPDGITSTGASQEEIILALCHHNISTLHGRQLSGIWGVSRGWGLEQENKKGQRGYAKTNQVPMCFNVVEFIITHFKKHESR